MPRTNNGAEGFHNALRTNVTADHPNIWSLIDSLKKEEGLARTKLAHAMRGDAIRQAKKYRDANDRISRLLFAYDRNDKLNFLKGIALNLKQF